MIYLFNNQEQLIKMLSSDCFKSVGQTQTLTDEKYISDKLYIETRNLSDDLLAETEYIAIQSVESKQKIDLYFLLRYRHDDELTILDCVQSGIEELMKTPVYDIRPQGVARDHANKILEGSQWTVQYVPETGRGQQNYYYIDAFTALKKMCSYFNIEMQFHVEITGNRIGARYIEFKKRIGQVTHKRVTYGHNALEIVKETQKDQIYTALIGRGRGEQVSSAGDTTADGKVQESDGYGRKITFEDIVWSKAKGNPVDKPKGQQYVEDVEATRKFGVITSKGVKPKIGFIEFDTDDREELLKRTYETLEEYSRPRVELKTSAVYLDARIGDTVRVVRHDLGIDYPVRVFEVKWDRLTNSIVELRLGDILHESASKRQSRMMNAIKGEISSATGDMAGKLIDHVTSANGFTMNYYSKTEPKEPKIGDSWFAPDPENEGHYILRMWNGESWEEIVRTKNWNVVSDKIKEAENRVTVFREEFEEKQQRNENELKNFRKSQNKKWKDIQIEIENIGSGLSAAINNVKSGVNSRITQLSSQIDLRVTRKDVEGIINNSGDAIYLAVKDKIKIPEPKKMTGQEIKNAIAIDQSGVQITGKHLGITADTYIEKGVIKESHIGTLSANKITTGVLNAADVKIINLDVKNISGMTSNFVRSLWNGPDSSVYLTGSGIDFYHNDGSKTQIGRDGMYFYDGISKYETHFMRDVITVSDLDHDSGRGFKWVSLPRVYRGKKFSAQVAFSDACIWQDTSGGYNNGSLTLQRIVCYVQRDSIDYTNAQVPLVGYARYWDRRYGKPVNFPIQVQLIVTY